MPQCVEGQESGQWNSWVMGSLADGWRDGEMDLRLSEKRGEWVDGQSQGQSGSQRTAKMEGPGHSCPTGLGSSF